MNVFRILAITLVVFGTLTLVYGDVSYRGYAPAARFGPLALSVNETTINSPAWAGLGAVFVGGLLLVFTNRKHD